MRDRSTAPHHAKKAWFALPKLLFVLAMPHSESPAENFATPNSAPTDYVVEQAIAPDLSLATPATDTPVGDEILTTSQLTLLTHAMDRLAERTERLECRQDKIVDIIEKMQEHQEKLTQAQQMLAQTQYRITESAAQSTNVQAQLAANLASTHAAVERLDRLMDFVLKQTPADQEISEWW
jgi:hypothetical protein